MSDGTSHEIEPAVQADHDPVPDPGLPPHQPRPTDVDPAAERRAERQVARLFLVAAGFSVLFCVCYFAFSNGPGGDTVLGLGLSNVSLGLCLALALLCLGCGLIQWARKLMSDHEIVENRHPASSSDEDRTEALAAFNAGVDDSGIARRPLIRNTLLIGVGALGLPAIVALRDLGPLPGRHYYNTVWRRGMRVVQDVDFAAIKPGDMQVGQLVNGEPSVFGKKDSHGEPVYSGSKLNDAKAKAAVILVRMDPDDITPAKGRENWSVNGILCYSKICTHVGCPISLYEQQTHHVLCPCHQSTFDLADNGKVLFGPAARPLPQLPLYVDSEGYLAAQSPFHEPVGPSFWERG
ncbi:MAG: cytochrome bc1 complex Rieske iron-sulfur subunit [Marmoricola sp.]